MSVWRKLRFPRIVLLAAAGGLLFRASLEFRDMAWGTGTWLGDFSLKWALAFALFVMFCVATLVAQGFALWPGARASAFLSSLARLRVRLGCIRWALVSIAIILPVWFLQYTPWGVVISKPYSRILIWCLSSLLIGFSMTREQNCLLSFRGFVIGTLLSGAAFAVAAPFAGVTSYPFSLGWSEGNRLWDYSVLFGKHLYEYSPGQEPAAYLDIGRELAGGLPFLLPHVSIVGERFWLAALAVLPYLILGFLAFWPSPEDVGASWILAAIWSFMFLSQGPIHTPLLFCAMLVAIARHRSPWVAAVLVAVASYAAEISRFTWMFAPAMWIVMLKLGDLSLGTEASRSVAWRTALSVGIGGLLGSAFGIATGLIPGSRTLGEATAASTQQPLLWYRLFPNATYGDGILLGLLIAAAPLALALIYLGARYWKLSVLPSIFITLSLIAFLVVGLVISTKIGGGGDLHNMDMFLIGLIFTAALAWSALGTQSLVRLGKSSPWIQAGMIFLVAAPAFQPLMALRPISFSRDANWLAVLADVERPRDLGSLPANDVVVGSVRSIDDAVQEAQTRGEVLFMDQRQLLTFGLVRTVPLVADYEKKRMMDEALSGNLAYFESFYRDLASRRFALIVSSPLRTPIRDSDYGFGEENNAWVKWVARPVLCYYEEKDTLTEVKVELLVPRTAPVDCSAVLP